MSKFEYNIIPRSDNEIIADLIHEAQDNYVNIVDQPEREPQFADEIINLGTTEEIAKQVKSKFCSSIKPALLSMAIQHVLGKCFSKSISEDAKAVTPNLVNNFIEENGVEDLLSRFRRKSIFLSEIASTIDDYYERIIKESGTDTEDTDAVEYYIDPDTKEDFFKDIKDIEDEEVILSIQNRVSDAISQFINKNTEQKLEIKNVLDDTVNKVNNVPTDEEMDEEESDKEDEEETTEEDVEESTMYSDSYIAMQEINRIKDRPSNVFEKMVYNMTSRVIKNDYMHEAYMNGTRPNMDAIMESCEVLYTFLEMCNTSKMIDVDENFIQDIINE